MRNLQGGGGGGNYGSGGAVRGDGLCNTSGIVLKSEREGGNSLRAEQEQIQI